MYYHIKADRIVRKELNISGFKIILDKIDNLDELIDQITNEQFNQDERIPYWAELWPSGIAMAEFILTHQSEFDGKKIIELGSGLGLAGIAAHMAGGNIVFSDYEEQSLEFCKKNFYLNFKSYPETRLIDWREIKTNDTYELLIASDVLYEKRFIEPFLHAISKMCDSNGYVYITEPNRSIAKPFFKTINPEFIIDFQKDFEIKNGNNLNTITIYKLIKC